MKTQIGEVSVEERDVIRLLHKRRNSLFELDKIVGKDDELYGRLQDDLAQQNHKILGWWKTMAEKYQWPSDDKSYWEIDFDSCKIFLKTKV